MNSVFLCGGAREQTLKYLLCKNENIVGVITPYLSPKNYRFEKVITTAIEYGVPVYPVKRDTVDNTLDKLKFDVLISCGFPYILSKKHITGTRPAINVHPTLLPKYRGFRSGAYVIINGEKETGTTVHFMTGEVDKGDILGQQSFPITAFDTIKSVYRKNQCIEGPLVYKVLRAIENGTVVPNPQDESKALTISYNRTPDDSEVDWNKPLKDLFNEIKACDPDNYPAFFYVEGQKVCIKLWRPDKPSDEADMI